MDNTTGLTVGALDGMLVVRLLVGLIVGELDGTLVDGLLVGLAVGNVEGLHGSELGLVGGW